MKRKQSGRRLARAVGQHIKMKKKERKSFDLDGFGKLYLNHDKTGFFWFGNVQNVIKENLVELTIEAESDKEPNPAQIESINELIKNKSVVEESVLQYMEDSFRGSKWERSKRELAAMYYLSAITLKRNQDWWIVFEPNGNVETIFNFFPRFTIRDYKVEWSNIKE